MKQKKPPIEWPTFLVLGLCYGVWALATWAAGGPAGWIWWPVVVLVITLHSSLQHEALHGHPTRNETVNSLLVFPAVGLLMPYLRFRTLHRAHHATEDLTDPARDNESFFLTPDDWARTSPPVRLLLRLNNTLAGRLTLGPAIVLTRFYRAELRAAMRGDREVLIAWALHLPGVVLALAWAVGVCGLHPVAYAAAAYAGYGVLMLRTFAEHRLHETQAGRSVIIEDRGLFSLIFLNNNLHAVHHGHPGAPWYALPRLFAESRERTLAENGGYRFAGYGALFRRYALRAKDPVVHPGHEAAA